MPTTVLIYLLFMFIGISFNLAGVVTIDIAQTFTVDTSKVGYVFGLFTIGYSLAIWGNGLLLDRVSIKLLMFLAIGLTFAGVILAIQQSGIALFAGAILFSGIGMGILCSNGNYFLVRHYYGKERASKLNVLNFFFSFGAIAGPLAAGQLLKRGVVWQDIYLLSLIPLAILAIFTFFANFEKRCGETEAALNVPEQWHKNIYLVGAALFFYVISEMILTYWIVIYFVEYLGVHVASASAALSVFWIFMALGRLFSGMVANKMRGIYFILISSCFSSVIFYIMMQLKEPNTVMILVGMLGLGYSGLYASILAYGTLQLKQASAKLLTFFVTAGSVGGILAFLLSSFLKQYFSIRSSLIVSEISIGLVFLIIGVSAFSNRKGN